MKRGLAAVLLMLGLYSIALFAADVHYGQDAVRGIFSDIITGTDYPLPYRVFFGINTTLSVVMLSGVALLFLVCGSFGRYAAIPNARLWFHWSQVLFFLYLACDERLMIHEKAGSLLHVEDAFLIFGLGGIEILLLLLIGDLESQPWKVKGWLLPAMACFLIMGLVDALVPSRIRGRLALEDLSKVWAILFLLIYAWQYCMTFIASSVREASDGT